MLKSFLLYIQKRQATDQARTAKHMQDEEPANESNLFARQLQNSLAQHKVQLRANQPHGPQEAPAHVLVCARYGYFFVLIVATRGSNASSAVVVIVAKNQSNDFDVQLEHTLSAIDAATAL